MVDAYEQSSEFHRSRQPDVESGNRQVDHDGPTPNSQDRTLPGLPSLMNNASLSASYNAPVRAQVIHQMQHTHGNRAVQRQVAAHALGGQVPVQRAPSSTEAYLEMFKKQWGEGAPLDYARKHMGKEPATGNGPYAHAGQNEAGGYGFEVGLARDEQFLEGVRQDVVYADGTVGPWKEPDGGTQYGIKANAGVYRTRGQNGGLDLSTASSESSVGEDGIRSQVGANIAAFEGTTGDFDKDSHTDTQLRGGLSEGFSAGARIHWGDSDKDGYRNWGLGVDYGPVSADIKTENPLFLGPVPMMIDYFGDDGPSKEQQTKNQMAYTRKIEQIEKNKEEIIKQKDPVAYYDMYTRALLPPQMQAVLQGAAPTQNAVPTTPLSNQDESLDFMTNFHEVMATRPR